MPSVDHFAAPLSIFLAPQGCGLQPGAGSPTRPPVAHNPKARRAQAGSRARSGERSERTLDADEHGETMGWAMGGPPDQMAPLFYAQQTP